MFLKIFFQFFKIRRKLDLIEKFSFSILYAHEDKDGGNIETSQISPRINFRNFVLNRGKEITEV